MGGAMGAHVNMLCDGVNSTIEHVKRCMGDLEKAAEARQAAVDGKECVKAIEKICSAAEKALKKGMKMAEKELTGQDEEVEVEVVGESKMAHGYDLTAGKLPPEFIENAKKKKEEAAAKKGDDKDDESKKASHGYQLTAESKTPGNESKGPKEEGEEDDGWVPGHRTGEPKKASHGYSLTV